MRLIRRLDDDAVDRISRVICEIVCAIQVTKNVVLRSEDDSSRESLSIESLRYSERVHCTHNKTRAMSEKTSRMFADVTIEVTSDISAECLARAMEQESEMSTKTNETKSPLTIAASLMAGALLLAATGLADAKDKAKMSHDGQPRLVEESGAGFRQEGSQKDRDDKHKHKARYEDDDKDKHKHKHANRCGDKMKCPTPKPIGTIHGTPPRSPPSHDL